MSIKDKIIKYIKIIFTLFCAFMISILLHKIVFPNNSPTMRPNLVKYIASKLKLVKTQEGQTEKTKQELVQIPFQSIAKGTKAKSKENVYVMDYDMSKVNWVKKSIKEKKGDKSEEVVYVVPEGVEILKR